MLPASALLLCTRVPDVPWGHVGHAQRIFGRRTVRLVLGARHTTPRHPGDSGDALDPTPGLVLWLRGLRGGCSVRSTSSTTKVALVACHLPRLHDSTTHEDLSIASGERCESVAEKRSEQRTTHHGLHEAPSARHGCPTPNNTE
jgi:hypothetical protein